MKKLNEILNSATNDDFTAADRMYSQNFRSEPFKLSEVEDWEDLKNELIFNLGVDLYKNRTGIDINLIPCEYEFESHIDNVLSMVDGVEITKDSKVVTLCNYKGEPDLVVLFETSKHLPIFENKERSFFQTN